MTQTQTALQDEPNPVPTGLALTALDARFREDPYPVLEELRRREPVHYDAVLKRYLLTRHADVDAVLHDLSLWSDPRKANPGTSTAQFIERMGEREPSMLMMDDPNHKRLRDLVRRSFTPRAVDKWRPRIRAIAERIVNAVENDTFDLIAKVAGPLPSIVIAEMLGVDASQHLAFKEWSDISTKVGFNPAPEPADVERAEAARKSLDALFRGEIEKRRHAATDDLIGDMVTAEIEGDSLTDEEIVTQCNLLLIAGNVTTADLIGNAMKALSDFPDQAAKLRLRPDLLENAVKEALRYDSPVIDSGRIASADLEIGGVKIAKGESVDVSLAAANRDPAVHPNPDQFDIEREEIHLMSFGGGRHFCLGSHLAKIEAQEALRALLARFDNISAATEGSVRAATPGFRGFESLILTGRPAGS